MKGSIMKIQEEIKGKVLVLKLDGELMGGDELKPFQERIYKSIREGMTRVIVDMAQVKWMNSSGLGVLMAALTSLRSSEGDLKLANVPDRVKRPIQITKLDQVLQMFDSQEAAEKSFEAGG
jgi:anti-sigma B factor antagonist